MTVEDIINMINTRIAGLEERAELEKERGETIVHIALVAKQNALLQLRIDILEQMPNQT